ncbi:MAG: hypothetical protein U5Q03_12620 [Bacteroidota bacterium]|nr:hypothetical protein [Bacteroidota bacterium]
MKKILIALISLFFVCASFNLQAQEHKNELSVSYGLATINDFGNIFANLFSDVIISAFGPDAVNTDTKTSGAFLLTYQYYFTNVISAGPVIGYEKLTDEISVDKSPAGKIEHNAFTFAAEGRINYVNKASFGMYLGIGAGLTSINSKTTSSKAGSQDPDSSSGFTFHVTGLGIRVGDQLAASAELGFGYRGLLNLGVSYRF